MAHSGLRCMGAGVPIRERHCKRLRQQQSPRPEWLIIESGQAYLSGMEAVNTYFSDRPTIRDKALFTFELARKFSFFPFRTLSSIFRSINIMWLFAHLTSFETFLKPVVAVRLSTVYSSSSVRNLRRKVNLHNSHVRVKKRGSAEVVLWKLGHCNSGKEKCVPVPLGVLHSCGASPISHQDLVSVKSFEAPIQGEILPNN